MFGTSWNLILPDRFFVKTKNFLKDELKMERAKNKKKREELAGMLRKNNKKE
jgi:hypothetical protein